MRVDENVSIYGITVVKKEEEKPETAEETEPVDGENPIAVETTEPTEPTESAESEATESTDESTEG